ncbi:hypothetical protein [Gemmatimonas sp.]|uniref:hypothetical protein n=1 Tax=Gemmatimonas sp. TaxID=1962908 RepID=UPI00286EADA3|nr:hypothetical protein [Gemmatimonas sp.]
MIPIQILRVLSTIRRFDVPALLMGGQACVLYGAAEYSRDIDLAVLATDDALPRLTAALQSLQATVIAVPAFERHFLTRGHAVHFSVPATVDLGPVPPLRVDIMSHMRGVAPFETLWERRTTIALADPSSTEEILVDLLSLGDLVQAKKTQRDKDWPMLRRLVDASYASARDGELSDEQIDFRLTELRSPEFLQEAVVQFPGQAASSHPPAVIAARSDGDMAAALASEQATEMAADCAYWEPLRRELEALRHAARRSVAGDRTGSA